MLKISMWNIFHNLPFSDKIPMIKDGSPSITCARWITSSCLNKDAVYVGREKDFFYTGRENAIIVHRQDLILVGQVEPEDLFNEICCLLDSFEAWEEQLIRCEKQPDGLNQMLNASRHLLHNPSFIYAPDGKALAIAAGFPPSVHWHWKEILDHHGLTEERLLNLKESISLTDVFQDLSPTIRDSKMGEHQYMHCSILANGYMAGHLVVFSMLTPFTEGQEILVKNLVRHMSRHMENHFSEYSPSSRLSEIIISILSHRPYEEKGFQLLLRTMRWNEHDEFRFFALKENVVHEPVLLANVFIRLSDQLKNAVTFQIGTQLVILENQTHMRAWNTADATVRKLLEDNFICGVSNIFKGLKQCELYYAQANYELEQCIKRSKSISYAEERSLPFFLKLLTENRLSKAYVYQPLTVLKAYDAEHGTEFYETLRAYFYCGFHMSDAARMLRIHRNSLTYRLDKIRELIDFQIFDQLAMSGDFNELNRLFLSFLYLDAENMEIR